MTSILSFDYCCVGALLQRATHPNINKSNEIVITKQPPQLKKLIENIDFSPFSKQGIVTIAATSLNLDIIKILRVIKINDQENEN